MPLTPSVVRLRLAVAAVALAVYPSCARAQAPSASTYQSLTFRHIGPPGNRVNAVAGVVGDPSVVYAGTASGGIFKSTDSGVTWTQLASTTSPAAAWGGFRAPPFRRDRSRR